MKIDHDAFVDIDVVQFLEEKIAVQLPAIHALTGCDTTSSYPCIEKVKLIKKIIKQADSLILLQKFGAEDNLSEQVFENVSKFVQTSMYKGKLNEQLAETRVRLYKALKKVFGSNSTRS